MAYKRKAVIFGFIGFLAVTLVIAFIVNEYHYHLPIGGPTAISTVRVNTGGEFNNNVMLCGKEYRAPKILVDDVDLIVRLGELLTERKNSHLCEIATFNSSKGKLDATIEPLTIEPNEKQRKVVRGGYALTTTSSEVFYVFLKDAEPMYGEDSAVKLCIPEDTMGMLYWGNCESNTHPILSTMSPPLPWSFPINVLWIYE